MREGKIVRKGRYLLKAEIENPITKN